MPLAGEIMKRDVITVTPEMTVEELGRLFMEKNIGWHAGALSKEDMDKAMAEVDASLAKTGSTSK